MKNIFTKNKKLDFRTAFQYPFNRAKRMWNILWVFVPIFGWLALLGYRIRIVREFSKGKYKELPVMNFNKDMKLGFIMLLKAIPFIAVCITIFTVPYFVQDWIGIFVECFLSIFILPILVVHFFNKGTVESFFELRVLNAVFNNFGEYLVAILKNFALSFVYILMIIILVGIPAGVFTKTIFLADFYRRKV